MSMAYEPMKKKSFLTRMKVAKSINAYMLQETHLEGNFIKILPMGRFLIHHGPDMQPHQGAKEGIAIILSPEMMENWKRGRSIIWHGGTTIRETTRLLYV